MNLDEAIAVYLYLWHKPRWKGELKAKNEAWGVINKYAAPIVASYMRAEGGEDELPQMTEQRPCHTTKNAGAWLRCF